MSVNKGRHWSRSSIIQCVAMRKVVDIAKKRVTDKSALNGMVCLSCIECKCKFKRFPSKMRPKRLCPGCFEKDKGYKQKNVYYLSEKDKQKIVASNEIEGVTVRKLSAREMMKIKVDRHRSIINKKRL